MTHTTSAGAAALVAKLTALSGMGAVQIGVPESIGKKVSAYVTAGGQTSTRKTTGTTAKDKRYTCTLAYRVDNAESTAETTLMDLADDFQDALDADLTLGGVCKSLDYDTSLADTPQYMLHAGQEFREFPITVTLRQYGAFNTNP